jgi:hypothetical protein
LDCRFPQLAKRISLTHVWLVMPLALSFILLCMMPLKEGDLWWHLKLGETMVTTQRIPDADMFSFTAAGQPYSISYSWLSDVLFYLLTRIGGLSALVLFQAGVGLSLTGLLLHECLIRGASAPLAAAIVLLGWIGLSPFGSTRPQVFSVLLFALFVSIVSAYARGRSNRLWLLPLLMIAWVNLHGGWVMGLILLVLYAFGLTAEKLACKTHDPALRPLIAWGAIALGAVLLNPDTWRVYQSVVSFEGNAIIQQFVSEWQPLVITNPLSWPYFGMLALWVLGLIYSQKQPRFHEVVLIFGFGVCALRYLRAEPFFLIIATPITAELIAGLKCAPLQSRVVRWAYAGPGVPANRAMLNLLLLSALIFGSIVSLPPLRLALTGQPESSLISSYFPRAATEILAEISAPGARLYSMPEWGGYLIWRLYPRATVFVDGRVELYPTSIWEDYLHIATASASWSELLDRYRVDFMVLSKERHRALIQAASRQGWFCRAEDHESVILARSPGAGNRPCLSLPALTQ